MEQDWKVGGTPKHSVVRAALVTVVLTVSWAFSFPALATHEADHRFTIEGYVCEPDGLPVREELVVVKDTRASIKQSVYTDSNGYYKAVLHLHNDNVGDPILVTVREMEQRAKAEFDLKDLETERVIQIHFGAGCEEAASSPPMWVLYAAGAVAAGLGGYAGVKAIRRRRRIAQRKGKGQRKQRAG